MSSSPLVTGEHHRTVQFGSNFHTIHFDEPAPADHNKSDLLRVRLTEVLGSFQDVSPRLLSDLNEDPDLLYGIDTPNTPISPPRSKGTSPFSSAIINNSPKHHKQRHQSNTSGKKTGKMMGPNGRVISPGNSLKRQPPKAVLNSSSTKPIDRTNPVQPQRRPQHPFEMAPLSNKHKYRPHTSSPNPSSNSNNTFSVKGEGGNDQKTKLKKPMQSSLNALPNNKKPGGPRDSISRILQSNVINLKPNKSENPEPAHRISPKDDSKPISAVHSDLDKSKQSAKASDELEFRSRKLPKLDIALDRDNDSHDDSINQLLFKGMEPLPTPLDDLLTPSINKKFGNFPSPNLSQPRAPYSSRPVDPQIRPPQPIRQNSPMDPGHNSSESADSSDSDTDRRVAGQAINLSLSSDTSDSSDAGSPMHRSGDNQVDEEDVFPPSPRKDLVSARTTHSSFSSDSSDDEDDTRVWSKPGSHSTRSNHTPTPFVKTELHSTSSQHFSSPRDVKPNIHTLNTNSNRIKNPLVKRPQMEADDSDSCSPDRKRFKVSISLNKIELRKSFLVSFPLEKLSLVKDKPPESSKQTARVQPIQRHIPDSSKDNPPPFSQLPSPPSLSRDVHRQVVVPPPQKISRKSPQNMMDYKSPDAPWHKNPSYDPSQIITSTPKSSTVPANSRWSTGDPPLIARPTKVSASYDYLTEAKRLKHQADRYKSNYDKALYYCEAALSFMLYGDQLELTNKPTATSTYSDTFELLDFVLRPSTGSEGGLGFSNESHPQLILICLRCQSVIQNRIFVNKQEGEKTSHKELHEFFSGYKSDTKAKTPVSNSPYPDSQWSPIMVSVPQKIANINSDYLQVMEYSFRSMELWNRSQPFEEDSLTFIQKVNNSVGKGIDRFSSIRDTTSWCKVGLSWLKPDRT